MKQILLFIILILFFACSRHDNKKNKNDFKDTLNTVNKDSSKVLFERINKLFVIGDFDGDGKIDTIFQNNISKINRKSIDSIPQYFESDTLERYFDLIGSDINLRMNINKCDTLHLGSGYGLFCLINIGDNNKDKKDEIAFVVDHCEFTNILTCYIFTICDKKWVELKKFKIHKGAFDFDEGENPYIFKEIKGFLEYRKKKWMYIDYDKWWSAKSNEDTVLRPIKIKKGC